MKRIVDHVKLLVLVAFGLLSQSLFAQKVVFVGDYITYQWASAFTANPNWINQGNPEAIYLNSHESVNMTNVESLHPAAIHILIGLSEAASTEDPTAATVVPAFLYELNSIVQEAKAAGIKVILGIEPAPPGVNTSYLLQMNSAVASYGAEYNLPAINYADALCNCVSSLGGVVSNSFQENPGAFPASPVVPWDDDGTVTPAGYSLMTQLAESVINTMNLKLVTGWLSDIEQPNNQIEVGPGPVANVNTVNTPAVVKFTPVGYYSDGSQHPMLNTTFQGSSGTWTSSNPLVMYVNQKGLAWAISQGTARISYTSPTGVVFSPWVMYVNAIGEAGSVPPCCT